MKIAIYTIIVPVFLSLSACDSNVRKNTQNEKIDVNSYEDNAYFIKQGEKYQNGIGVQKDYEKAFDYFLKAAKNNDPVAQNIIASYYMGGIGKIKINYESAFEWYRKSAELGSLTGIYNLGLAYFHGIGVNEDKNKATNLFQIAANKNMPEALNQLAIQYINGEIVEKNLEKAFELNLLSAQQNYAPAMNDVGLAYQMGTGVEKNTLKATEWFKKSSNLGNANAYFNLAIKYESGDGIDKNEEKAISFYQLAADHGKKEAMEILIEIYSDKLSNFYNPNKAMEFENKLRN